MKISAGFFIKITCKGEKNMLNTAAILGRLVADPELKHTPNDIAVTTFTLAVDRSYAPPPAYSGEDNMGFEEILGDEALPF